MIGSDDRIERVIILGGGTAALLTAAAFARHLPDIEVVMVRSKKMGIIGVGEGTIVTIGRFLHRYLGIDPVRFHREVHPSIKLGIQFDWGAETPYHYSFTPQYSAGNPAQSKLSHPVGDYCRSEATFADLSSSLMYHGKVTAAGPDGNPVQSPSFAYHLENRRFVEFLEQWVKEHGIEAVDA
ncbi:tryptophan 7-halogenase, partial [Verrucomicrobiales bacterium]|nr:tryptophan 7-halogenase [Verrucomicrobiales bacterium]